MFSHKAALTPRHGNVADVKMPLYEFCEFLFSQYSYTAGISSYADIETNFPVDGTYPSGMYVVIILEGSKTPGMLNPVLSYHPVLDILFLKFLRLIEFLGILLIDDPEEYTEASKVATSCLLKTLPSPLINNPVLEYPIGAEDACKKSADGI